MTYNEPFIIDLCRTEYTDHIGSVFQVSGIECYPVKTYRKTYPVQDFSDHTTGKIIQYNLIITDLVNAEHQAGGII